QVTTGSLEALRLYTEGARLSEHGQEAQAVERLEQAIALDSGFAMAWRKLAVALSNSLGGEERTIAAITRAWQHRERLPEIERQLTIGFYHSTADFDRAKEEAAYRRVLELQPGNYVALNNLSLLLSGMGRPVEAESLALVGTRIDPDPGNMYLQLMLARVLLGKDSAARSVLDTMERRSPGLAMNSWGRGLALSAMRDWDGAQRAFQDLVSGPNRDLDNQAFGHQGLARVARTRGRLAESERHARADMAVSEQRGLKSIALRDAAELARAALVFRSDSAGALRIVDSALEAYPLASMPVLDRPSSDLALVYVLAGQRTRASQLLAEQATQVPEGVRRARWEWHLARGWLALAEGKPRDALAAFVAGRHSDFCSGCGWWDEGVAYERAGLPDSALASYERAAARGAPWRSRADQWTLAASFKRLGEMYETRGEKDKALKYYGQFAELWKDADPVLQPQVREVKQRMAALAGEGK
ncbi:MAG TPA: hypothetical protein VEB59_15020, partial [Gemmatimonadales bacterium]|nr:hypothetical protein [Gemmatimonadales bacterium]